MDRRPRQRLLRPPQGRDRRHGAARRVGGGGLPEALRRWSLARSQEAAQKLVAALDAAERELSPERLRVMRGLEVLERAGTPAAGKLKEAGRRRRARG
ncbi:MAG: hypothetical protein U0797_12760 [Gemmataceae bacterium]